MEIETPPAVKPYEKPDGERRGLVIVNTGDGKGKSAAAFGLALRAHGRGKAVKLWQFMSVPDVPGALKGEHRMFEQLGIPIEALHDGCNGLARDGWCRAKASILSGEFFLVVLDDSIGALNRGELALDDVLTALRERPAHVHVVLTGRRCPPELIALADTVTDMQLVKHETEDRLP